MSPNRECMHVPTFPAGVDGAARGCWWGCEEPERGSAFDRCYNPPFLLDNCQCERCVILQQCTQLKVGTSADPVTTCSLCLLTAHTMSTKQDKSLSALLGREKDVSGAHTIFPTHVLCCASIAAATQQCACRAIHPLPSIRLIPTHDARSRER